MRRLVLAFLWLLALPAGAATITHGPVLRAPTASGFSVWVKCDAPATVVLETSPAGAGTWTSQATQATDAAQFDTALLSATGLSAATKYDYRLTVNGSVLGNYYTVTMPATTGGHFLVYVLSDTHEDNDTVWEAVLAHWRTNFPGVPAVALMIGDLVEHIPDVNPSDPLLVFLQDALGEISAVGNLPRYMPFLYQFDDWDWAGNNSSSTRFPMGGSMANVDLLQGALWRQPGGKVASPSWAYQVVVGGIPILMADTRSQRTQTGMTPYNEGRTGTESPSDSYTVFGSTQRTWLNARMAEYRTKGLILMDGNSTWKDHTGSPTVDGLALESVRDSVGIWFINERNAVLAGLDSGGYPSGTRLVLLSGDDHRDSVWSEDFRATAYAWDAAPSGGFLGFNHVEMKVMSGTPPWVSQSSTWFGSDGGMFDYRAGSKPSAILIDVTSSSSGATADARFTYLNLGAGAVPWKDGLGRVGDFRLTGGAFTSF